MNLDNKCVYKIRRNRCKVLIVRNCLGDKCPFKKTKKQQSEMEKATFKRLASLDKIKQVHIAEKYYNSSMPWQSKRR